MATRAVFTPKAAEYGATIFPQLLLVNRRPVLRFDGATDEECQWTTVAPQGLTGTVTCLIFFMAVSATTGTIRWEATLEAITPGDATDLDAGDSFAASNSNGGAVPGTAGFLETIGITLTNADSIAPGLLSLPPAP